MTARPQTSKRPLSAIFIGGNLSIENQLPELPVPPESPISSGLPSPPATVTNSTSSGSNGGADSTIGSIRISSTLEIKSNMKNGASSGRRSSSRSSSDDGDDVNDEDHTAKLSGDRRRTLQDNSGDGQSALQRVKNLSQRNRMVLNRLASFSSGTRLSTPPPPSTRRSSQSPAPSSMTSTRVSEKGTRRDRSVSISHASGSETERERMPNATSSSDDLSEPSSSTSTRLYRSESVRERRISASISPSEENELFSSRDKSVGPGDSSTVGRRGLRSESRASGDIEAAALAAVAKSRRRSASDSRKRQPLPREFRTERSDAKHLPDLSMTLHGASDRVSPGPYSGRRSPSQSSLVATAHDSPRSPRHRTQRFSTVRELTRRHQTRWLSQDLTSPTKNNLDSPEMGRPQNRRGGSSESPLASLGSRSVVGESLRAAGLARRRDEGDDPFSAEPISFVGRRPRLSGDFGTVSGIGRVEAIRPSTRLGDRTSTSDRASYMEPRTPANSTQLSAKRNSQSTVSARPATSMAAYKEEPRTAPPLRSHKSSNTMPDNRSQSAIFVSDGLSQVQSQARTTYPISSAAAQGRSSASPSTIGRRTTITPFNMASNNLASTPDHTRLMLDSLNMFESQLARLPSMGSTSTITVPDLFRSAQNIVHSANALNTLLRNGTSHALEEQIDAEVGDDGQRTDPVEIWRDVGGEYRESLRVSDELVRTMTSFLLGVGKLLRETMTDRTHSRTSSLDESITRRPDASLYSARTSDGKLSSDGRSSIDAKRRWDSSSGEMGGASTAFTSMHSSSASLPSSRPSVGSRSRVSVDQIERESDPPEPLNEASLRRFSRLSLTTPRRKDLSEDSLIGLSQESAPPTKMIFPDESTPVNDSPLASVGSTRSKSGTLRRATTLSIPPPLPSLPSESILDRASSMRTSRRPKVSSASNATVRANSIFPTTSGNPTTAVTAMAVHVSSELSPSNSRLSANTQSTISRTSGAALAGLQEQMKRDGRKRTLSANSAVETDLQPTLSGSETEREPRPRMSLDSNTGSVAAKVGTSGTRPRDRRGTVTGLFSRS